ncbi:MAG: type II toxin-antitoxin system Phd/YefM family antitoxin [Dermatophilaceae bacterium]
MGVTTVKVQYAKTHLSAILKDVEAGEEVVIARGDTPVAKLVPMPRHDRRQLGFLDVHVPDSAFDPLPDEAIALWENGIR